MAEAVENISSSPPMLPDFRKVITLENSIGQLGSLPKMVSTFSNISGYADNCTWSQFFSLGTAAVSYTHLIPAIEEQHRSWGELSGYRKELDLRNASIRDDYRKGSSLEELARRHCL